jgi:hypothetical protein
VTRVLRSFIRTSAIRGFGAPEHQAIGLPIFTVFPSGGESTLHRTGRVLVAIVLVVIARGDACPAPQLANKSVTAPARPSLPITKRAIGVTHP